MSNEESTPMYYYVQDSIKFNTMEACCKHYGSGMLVADHTVLDELADKKSALTQAEAERDELFSEVMRLKLLKDVEIADSMDRLSCAILQQQLTRVRSSRDEITEQRDAALARCAELEADLLGMEKKLRSIYEEKIKSLESEVNFLKRPDRLFDDVCE